MSSPETPKTPEALSAEAAERVRLAGIAAQQHVEVEGAKANISAGVSPAKPALVSIASMTSEELEAEINRILGIKKRQAQEAFQAKPAEPDWANLREIDALDMRVANIPIFEHEVPSYMDIKVADPNYEVVWANRDQRRVGHLLAEGYEFLRREHVDPDFQLPLKFDSEGMYIYVDVVAMRVHKRILWGKRRKVVEKSFHQLKRQEEVAKSKLSQITSRDPHLEEAFEEGKMAYFT